MEDLALGTSARTQNVIGYKNLFKPKRKRRARLNPVFAKEQREKAIIDEALKEKQREAWRIRQNNHRVREGEIPKKSAPKTNWPLIKTFSEQYGITEASKAFSTSYHTIYKRATKENWTIPSLLKSKKTEELQTAENKVIAMNESEKWSERAENHKELIYNLVQEAFTKTKLTGLPTIETPSDAKTYDEMARKTLGLDKIDDKSQNLRVNLAFLSQP